MAARFLDYGYTWVAVSSDLNMLVGRAHEYLAAVRAPGGPAAKAPQ